MVYLIVTNSNAQQSREVHSKAEQRTVKNLIALAHLGELDGVNPKYSLMDFKRG